MNKRKLLSLILAICMVISLAPTIAFAGGGDPGPGDPGPGNPGELRFDYKGQMITCGSIYYKRNNTEEFVKVSEENEQYNPITFTDADTSIAIKFVANEGYQLDTPRGVTLRVNGRDEFKSTDDNIADFTSESGYTFDLSNLVGDRAVTECSFELEFGFENENGGGPGPEPGDEPAHGGYEGVEKTASVTVAGKADFYINDSRMVNGNDGDSFDNVNYHYDGNGYVDFYFNCFISERITALKINDVDYYGQLPTPDTPEGKEALLEACKGQLNEFKITVPYSESGYAIESSVKWLDDADKDYMVVGNFLWTYTDENQGDDYIDHGRMELLGVKYNGMDYSPEDLNNPGTAIDWGQDENGGGAVLPVGAVVTVKLIPDYGYQLTRFGINGGDFGTGDEQSIFTFVIKPGNAHLGAHFTPVADKVTSSSDTVTDGSIELGSGLSGGSAQLEISDAENELSDEKLEAFEAAAGNYNITDYLNLDLYNVYYKGSTDADDVWKNKVNTLESDATISVSLATYPIEGTVDPSNIVIIHNIHNGEDFETIPVDSYDSETHTITFKTNSFSTYAIATNDGGIHMPSYSITEGTNSSWTQNSDGTLTFRANGDFSKFTGVKVDGTLIDAKNYTAVSGSTIVTLKADYLKTLSAGTHSLTVLFNDGECSANFEVKAAQIQNGGGSDSKKSSQTGDNSNFALWFVLLFVSGAGTLGTVVYSKRKKRAE